MNKQSVLESMKNGAILRHYEGHMKSYYQLGSDDISANTAKAVINSGLVEVTYTPESNYRNTYYIWKAEPENKQDSQAEETAQSAEDAAGEAEYQDVIAETQESAKEYSVKIDKYIENMAFIVAPDGRVITTGSQVATSHVAKNLLNQETASLRQRIAELEAQLEKASRMNINLAQANVDLQAENGRAMELLKLLHGMDYTQEAEDYLFAESDYENYAIVVNGIEWLNAKAQETPAQPEAAQAEATLTENEIEWIATQWNGESLVRILPFFLPEEWAHIFNPNYSERDESFVFYNLAPEYDTPANHAAIAARREELGHE